MLPFYCLHNFCFNAFSQPHQYPIATSNWKQRVNVSCIFLAKREREDDWMRNTNSFWSPSWLKPLLSNWVRYIRKLFAVQHRGTWCMDPIIVHMNHWLMVSNQRYQSKRLLSTEGQVGIRKSGQKQDVVHLLTCSSQGRVVGAESLCSSSRLLTIKHDTRKEVSLLDLLSKLED